MSDTRRIKVKPHEHDFSNIVFRQYETEYQCRVPGCTEFKIDFFECG